MEKALTKAKPNADTGIDLLPKEIAAVDRDLTLH